MRRQRERGRVTLSFSRASLTGRSERGITWVWRGEVLVLVVVPGEEEEEEGGEEEDRERGSIGSVGAAIAREGCNERKGRR